MHGPEENNFFGLAGNEWQVSWLRHCGHFRERRAMSFSTAIDAAVLPSPEGESRHGCPETVEGGVPVEMVLEHHGIKNASYFLNKARIIMLQSYQVHPGSESIIFDILKLF